MRVYQQTISSCSCWANDKLFVIVNQLSGMQFAEAAIKWNGIGSKSTVIMDPLLAALNCRNFDVEPGVDVETDKSELIDSLT